MVGLGEEQERGAAGDGRSARGAMSISSPSANISSRRRSITRVDRFVTPDEFETYRALGLRQGLPDGLGLAADALLLSRRRRFRASCARRARPGSQRAR